MTKDKSDTQIARLTAHEYPEIYKDAFEHYVGFFMGYLAIARKLKARWGLRAKVENLARTLQKWGKENNWDELKKISFKDKTEIDNYTDDVIASNVRIVRQVQKLVEAELATAKSLEDIPGTVFIPLSSSTNSLIKLLSRYNEKLNRKVVVSGDLEFELFMKACELIPEFRNKLPEIQAEYLRLLSVHNIKQRGSSTASDNNRSH